MTALAETSQEVKVKRNGKKFKPFSFLLSLVTFALVALLVALIVVPSIISAVPLTVLTGSMEPTYSPGDVVVVKVLKPGEAQVGDVVSFHPLPNDPTLITHRIVERNNSSEGVTYITRGDANGADDEPIKAEQIAGKVVYSVPYVGHFRNDLITNQEKGFLVLGLGGFLIAYGLFQMVLAPGTRKRSKRAKIK